MSIFSKAASGRASLILLVHMVLIGVNSSADDSGRIEPGDRLELRFSGPGYGASQLSVVETNGAISLGESGPIQVQGLSTNQASQVLCASLYVFEGKTNSVTNASVRRIASLPIPLQLSVSRGDGSNVVFRLTNPTTNVFRLPSDGYAFWDSFTPINTNPAYALIDKPEVHMGLWLTHDWRYVGQDWLLASKEAWEQRLKIQNLNPGGYLDITRSISFRDEITTNTVLRFSFAIPQEWAERYGLWEGDISVTGLSEGEAERTDGVCKLIESNGLYHIEINDVPDPH